MPRRGRNGARDYLELFATSSRYESEVKGTTLAMIRYMAEHWYGSDRAESFERWWKFVNRYAVALSKMMSVREANDQVSADQKTAKRVSGSAAAIGQASLPFESAAT